MMTNNTMHRTNQSSASVAWMEQRGIRELPRSASDSVLSQLCVLDFAALHRGYGLALHSFAKAIQITPPEADVADTLNRPEPIA